MEQTFQEQTAGCHRYLLRRMSGASGKTACIVCLGQKGYPLEPDDVQRFVHTVQERMTATLMLYYYVPQSLSHYGKVDSLAPAGAMEEFVEYVQELEREEAEEFFRDILQATGARSDVIHLVYEWHAWEAICDDIHKRFADCVLFEPLGADS